jgi:hypothetical protein
VAALGLLVLAIGCGGARGTPEEQLRAWVAAVESAAEDKERAPIMELVAAAYSDSRGNARDDVDKMLRLIFLRQNTIALLSAVEEIEVAGGNSATMIVTVGMAGTNDRGSVLSALSADAYRFELELEAEGDPESYADWRLLSARWGELGEPVR